MLLNILQPSKLVHKIFVILINPKEFWGEDWKVCIKQVVLFNTLQPKKLLCQALVDIHRVVLIQKSCTYKSVLNPVN